MIFDPLAFCELAEPRDLQFSTPQSLEGEGLWVGVLSSGQCALADEEAPQLAGAGSLLLGASPLRLVPAEPCHLAAVRLVGQAPAAFAAGLEGPMFAAGASCPGAAELVAQLVSAPSPRRASSLGYQLLCESARADAAAPSYPPLVTMAIAAMREHYAGLYGVEELSESLGVILSHLVRVFTAAVGVPPGQYLTGVRIEAAKQLLCHREYPLEVVASLCGFSGANYLCRVFKKATGQSPTAWRAAAAGVSELPELPQERELYV